MLAGLALQPAEASLGALADESHDAFGHPLAREQVEKRRLLAECRQRGQAVEVLRCLAQR